VLLVALGTAAVVMLFSAPLAASTSRTWATLCRVSVIDPGVKLDSPRLGAVVAFGLPS